ncbi:DUF6529 family protein [Streptomyces albulus]|uniref:DUF6529 family protein n=1 Tax=Streptomyces noursei TaxID=1971 RepID=UPI001F1D2E18|nr:DUF6529 family protein [Streptomyces noursei]MCE4941934.1 DUF6529 family protein [Streptomyces noursei]
MPRLTVRVEPRQFLGVLWLLLPLAVIAALLWYGLVHTPEPRRSLFGMQGPAVILLKTQLGSALLGLVLIQLLLALWMYGRLPGLRAAPHRVGTAHRLIGAFAFLFSIPTAQQCIIAYGVSLTGPRQALHSLAGCFLYGAFVAKVVVVRHRRWPGWALPLAGGALVTVIVLAWYSAAFWYLNGFHAPGL